MRGKAFATALALAALALGMLGLLARRTIVPVSRIGISLKQLDLLAGLHRRGSLDLSKKTSTR